MILSPDFFRSTDVLEISKNLLGKFLMTSIDGVVTGGMIIETEAYRGPNDRACHAYNNRKTKRTKVMFEEGGVAYVYLCYGMHALFNIVTGKKEEPHAVLIRAIKPTDGIELMKTRRNMSPNLANGPGSLTKALGIDISYTGLKLACISHKKNIWVEDRKNSIAKEQIHASPRIGIDYAGEDALLPWRFQLKT